MTRTASRTRDDELVRLLAPRLLSACQLRLVEAGHTLIALHPMQAWRSLGAGETDRRRSSSIVEMRGRGIGM